MEAGAVDGAPKGASLGAGRGTLTRLLEELARGPGCEPGRSWAQGLQPGEVLDRFEILREVGRGGFGAVYEAVDRELGRRVALKTLRPGRSRDEWADEQLRKEAQAAASLSHPGIVTLHEACTCDRGPYLVMELLRGETLETRLRRGPFPVEEAVEVGLQAARALAHVHAHHLVHRDLKPANVHLGQDGRVKLLDLGLAHLLGRRSPTGGTPAYVAPEQWRGEDVDGRADVFALGAILFEAVSGQRAFEVKEERSSALDPDPAPTLRGKLPQRLVRLVARCLSKDPGGRPTAAQAAEELLALQRRIDRPRAVRRLAVLAAAGAVLGAAVATAVWRRVPLAPQEVVHGRVVVAVADFSNQTGEPELDGLSGLLITSLEQSRGLAVLTRPRMLDLARRPGRDEPSRVDERVGREAARAANARALLLTTVRRAGSAYSVDLRALEPTRDEALFGAHEEAATRDGLLAAVDRLSARVQSKLAAGVATAAMKVGTAVTPNVEAYASYFEAVNLLAESWDVPRARAALRRAVAIDPDFALARLLLAALARSYSGTDDEWQEHLAAVRRLGDRLPEKERLLAALVAAERPEELRARAGELADRFPEDKMALYLAGALAREEGQPDLALDRLRRAVELDPAFAPALVDFVMLAAGSSRTDEALAAARRAVAARPGPHTLAPLGLAHAARGEREEAVREVRRALDLGAGRVSDTAIDIARVLFWAGRLQESESALHAWRDCAEPSCGGALMELGLIQVARGRLRETSRLAERLGSLSPAWKVEAHNLAGAERLASGDLAGAADEWAQALRGPAALAYVGSLEAAATVAREMPVDSFRLDFYRGILAWRSGDRQAGAAHLGRGLAKDGSQAQALFWLGEMKAEAGEHEQAARALERFLATFKLDSGVFPHAIRSKARLQLARSQMALGRTSSARATLDHLLEELGQADPDLPALAEAKALRRRLAAGGPAQ
ncbi:MAG TPA: protein kinase [Anaeromyxobacteraceae bacterium]|nr:protein kinase [Anaeromyxobacteraceae bacterium]